MYLSIIIINAFQIKPQCNRDVSRCFALAYKPLRDLNKYPVVPS
jgi:hypothetical protein